MPHREEEQARFDDENIKREVQQLIISEPDPKEKVRLLMLLQLNTSLVSNVVAVRNLTKEFKEHRMEFEAHLAAEEKLVNTGRGAIWAALILVGAIQFGSSYILNNLVTKLEAAHVVATEAAVTNRLQDEKIRSLEERVSVNGARITNNSAADATRRQ